MKLITSLISDQVIDALGWNLFHILWQGFLLAILLGLLLRIVKHKSAQLKYTIACISLLVLVGLSVYNITSNFQELNTNQTTFNTTHKVNEIYEYTPTELNAETQIGVTNKAITFMQEKIRGIDKYFSFLVPIWLLGVFIFATKITFGYIYSNRYKTIKTSKVADRWITLFSSIEKKLRIKRSVQYLESKLIHIPIVIGYLKPVVIIPAEMLTGMPSDQIEAIIAHEIAHIRRNDYIINILQTIIETVFFFHPAVWYISSQIRKERENCCDDIAVPVCKESLVYARALVSVQEICLNKHYSAVAFSSNKKHLLNRVKRIIMKPKEKSNITDKIIAALIIISGVIALSFTYSAKVYEYDIDDKLNSEKTKILKENIIAPITENFVANNDTIKIKKDRSYNHVEIEDNKIIKTYKNDGKKSKMEFRVKNGKAYDLYVDGRKIPENEYDKYQKEIDETIDDLEDAKKDIREAMKEIEEIDFEKIQKEVEEAMRNVHIDVAEIQKKVAKAMEEVNTVEMDEIMKEVEMSLNQLEDIHYDLDFDFGEMNIDMDMDDIKREVERARTEIRENVDMEAIEKELEKVHEELRNMDKEKIRQEIEFSLQDFDTYDKEKTLKEMEEKLIELEKLELKEK